MQVDPKILLTDYFSEALEETKNLIKIQSFKTKPCPEGPYGEGTKEVLFAIMALGKRLGFKTYQDSQNRYGFLEYGPEDGEIFAILCHLDVVPPGNLQQWMTPPFEPVVKNGRLIGRGAFDDKGPTIMNLYALKYLKDHHFQPQGYKIRMIFGLTEETTWESIRAYLADFGPAQAGYVPDGEFPVVYAEKWIVDYDLQGTLPTEFEIIGGTAYNVVNDYVIYRGPRVSQLVKQLHQLGLETEVLGPQELGVKGQAAHGSLPWLGLNAATYLAIALQKVGFQHPILDFLTQEIHLQHHWESRFKDLTDETGKLTQNLGLIEVRNGFQRLAFNFRVPVFANPHEKFLPILAKIIAPYQLTGQLIGVEDCVYVSPQSPMVTKMVQIYQAVTGDQKAVPLAIGGGTYAKAMPGLVAFGAEFDLTNSTMHAYNESVSLLDLQKMLEIYTKALVVLTSEKMQD